MGSDEEGPAGGGSSEQLWWGLSLSRDREPHAGQSPEQAWLRLLAIMSAHEDDINFLTEPPIKEHMSTLHSSYVYLVLNTLKACFRIR